MRFLSQMTLILAIGLMLPGSLELAQDALHMAVEGHTVHDEGDQHGDTDEHGCSGPYHFCGCCTSATFVVAPAIPTPPAAAQVALPELDTVSDPVPSAHVERLLRPPTA